VHDRRNASQARRHEGRQRGVPSDADHDGRPRRLHDAPRLREGSQRVPTSTQVRDREASLEATSGQQIDHISGFGDDACFEPTARPDESNRVSRVAARRERISQR
jgi:hypothetical protein